MTVWGNPLFTWHNPPIYAYNVATRYNPIANNVDVPDILTWLQRSSIAPDAIGTDMPIEGIHNMSFVSLGFVSQLSDSLLQINSFADLKSSWRSVLVGSLWSLISGVFANMGDSHRFPSIFYGLMHGENWNVYDTRSDPD